MAISKKQKETLLEQYSESIATSRGIIITEYRGLSAAKLSAIRTALREANGSYHIVKLTLFKLALQEAGIPVPEDLLTGPVAVGFCYQEVPAVAKIFKDYHKDEAQLVLKGGLLGTRKLSLKDVETIADLPPLEIVRAQLLGVLTGPARSLASVVAGGVRQVVNVLNAYAEKDNQEAGAEA